MQGKNRKSANDKPRSSPQPRPLQSVASESSSNVPRMPKQPTGYDAPGIGLPSKINQPSSSSSSSQISYHAVPPPASLNSGSPHWRTRKAATCSTANSSSPLLGPPTIIGFPTSHI